MRRTARERSRGATSGCVRPASTGFPEHCAASTAESIAGGIRSPRGRPRQPCTRTRVSTRGLAYALHLVGDHAGAEAASRAPNVQRVGGEHSRHLLLTLTAAASGRWDDVARELAAAAASVRRYRYPLTMNDCLMVCGALAALQGRLERACALLAAVADGGSVRSPEIWAVYLHYRRIVRAGLDAAIVGRCREEARTLDYERALDEELARHTPGT